MELSFTQGGLVVTTNRGRDRCGVGPLRPRRRPVGLARQRRRVGRDRLAAPDGTRMLGRTNTTAPPGWHLARRRRPARLRDVALPAVGCVTASRCPTRAGRRARRRCRCRSPAGSPGDALRLDAGTGEVRALTSRPPRSPASASRCRPCHRVPTPDGELVPCLVTGPARAGRLPRPCGRPRRAGGPGQAQLHLMAQALARPGTPCGAERPRLGRVRQALVLPRRCTPAARLRGRPRRHARLPGRPGARPGPGGPVRRLVRRLHGAGRAGLPAGAVGGRRGHRGHVVAGDVPGNTSPYRRAIREREYGSLAHDLDFLLEASPLGRIDDIARRCS